MSISITAGTRVYISLSTPSTYDLAGYNSIAYTELRGVASFGDVGYVYETIPYNVIGKIPYDRKVGLASQSIALEVYKITNAGQDLLAESTKLYSSATFKIVSPTGELTLFTAETSQMLKNLGEAQAIAKRTYTLNLTSEILETQ